MHTLASLSRYTVAILIVLCCAAPALASAGGSCETLLPSDVHRRTEGFEAETHCYRLDLPSPGLMHLDLSVTGASRARLKWTAADGSPAALDALWRSADERLQLAPSGSYFLEVSAEDPRRPLPAYRLRSRFLALPESEAGKSETDGELEVDPEPFAPTARKSETDGELEVDPEPFAACAQKSETDGELEVDPEPFQALCRDGDDHGDSFLCATAIHRAAAGELDNGWGDDVDVFRFRVRRWRTLEILAAGDVAAVGELYDGAGQRLAGQRLAQDGGDGGFRLVRTVGPGTYFVRLAATASSGAYRLEISGRADL